MSDYLFASVIPGIGGNPPPPITGRGNPNGFVKGIPAQVYTEETGGKTWGKGYHATDPSQGWFELGPQRGHPAVFVGGYYETNPNGVQQSVGPAVWFGPCNKSIWVKTGSDDDDQGWNLLGFSGTIGLPDYYSFQLTGS